MTGEHGPSTSSAISRSAQPTWLTAVYVATAALGILALVTLTALSALPSAAATATIAALAVASATTMAIGAAARDDRMGHGDNSVDVGAVTCHAAVNPRSSARAAQ